MKTHGKVEVRLHSFLSSTLDGGTQSTAAFPSSVTNEHKGWAGPTTGLDTAVAKIISASTGNQIPAYRPNPSRTNIYQLMNVEIEWRNSYFIFDRCWVWISLRHWRLNFLVVFQLPVGYRPKVRIKKASFYILPDSFTIILPLTTIQSTQFKYLN
jgi:hypothetical protein